VPGAWGDDDDLDLGDDDVPAPKSGGGGSGGGGGDFFAAPAAGTSALTQWCNNSSHASDHIAAGAFEGAMTLLNRQVAIVNFKPLKSKFVGIWAGAYASVPGLPLAPALRSPLQRNARDKPPPDGKSLPAVPLKLNVLIEKLKGESRVLFPGREMIYSYHHT
jgi:coatomer protein complex subunit alpha (xenin)